MTVKVNHECAEMHECSCGECSTLHLKSAVSSSTHLYSNGIIIHEVQKFREKGINSKLPILYEYVLLLLW